MAIQSRTVFSHRLIRLRQQTSGIGFVVSKRVSLFENQIDAKQVVWSATMSINNVSLRRITDTSMDIAWDATLPRYEIDYRCVGETKWQTIANVLAWENPYNVIMLKPATTYEFRVRGLPSPAADSEGTMAAMLPPVESAVMIAHTAKEPERRMFAGLRLDPSRPIPGGRTYPCIESHNGFLWHTDCALYLRKLDPEGGKVLWQSEQPIAAWPLPSPKGYMGIPDTTILGDTLWVMYNVQATRNPDYSITHSRQYFLSYDFATGAMSKSIIVEPTKPEYGSWEGGVQTWRGKLWVMHMDVWMEGALWRTRIVLRTFDNGKFSQPMIYENCPTIYPYGPSMSVFNDQLIILFSDLAATERNSNHEPLLYTIFDGKRFSKAKIIHDIGRNRYAKGIQAGNRFICAYKCNAPYFEKYDYEYHDIAMSLFTPGTDEEVETVMCVNDRKYNSSPDVALHGDRIVVVYNKLEHLYGKPENPAVDYGAWIGTITIIPANKGK